MPRKPDFRYRQLPSGKWTVNVPSSVTKSGKRERPEFPSRDRAKEYAAKLRTEFLEHGSNAETISPLLAEDATRAAEILKPWGCSLMQAANFYAAEMEKQRASILTMEACDEWLTIRESDSQQRTIENYRATARKIKTAVGNKIMATITKDQLQALIVPSGATPQTANANFRNTRAFWLWAAKKGWCEPNLIRHVELPKKQDRGEIEILTVQESVTLLEAACRYFPQAVPMYAIQLFAGIRPEESTKLEEKHFSDAGIELTAEVTKKRRRRHINPNPTLSAWLEKHPFKPCPNWKRVNAACRYLAGWDVKPETHFVEGKRRLANLGKPWPHDGMRHSHATYAVAAGTPLDSLLWEFGHTGSSTTLREHYVGRASKRDALSFFLITPEGTEKPQSISVA